MGPVSLSTLTGRQEAGALAWIKISQPSNLAQGWDQRRKPQFTFRSQSEAPGKENAWEIPKSSGQGENKPRLPGPQSTGELG